jgi:hypothetical protein
MWVQSGKPPTESGWYLVNKDGEGQLAEYYFAARYSEWYDEEGWQKQPKWWWQNESQ